MKIFISLSADSVFEKILEVSATRAKSNFDLVQIADHWYSNGDVENYYYRAISATQPDAQQVLYTKIMPADSWCSDSIYTAAQFLRGFKRLPVKGVEGLIAVFTAPVVVAERDYIQVKHFKTTHNAELKGIIKVRIV